MDVTPFLSFKIVPINPKTIVMNPHTLDWCHLPYYNAPKGCKMWNVCPYCPHHTKVDLDLPTKYKKYTLVLGNFDFLAYRKAMWKLHPDWGEGDVGNLRMWQGSVKSKMWKYIKPKFPNAIIYGGKSNSLGPSPEAVGVDLYNTFVRNGIPFEHTSSKKKWRKGKRYLDHATFCALICENTHSGQKKLF